MTTSAPATKEADASVGLVVSCICPTYNRREWISRSIECFLAQDYACRELLILDDGTDAIVDLVPNDSRIQYHRLDRKLSIGAKRNLACELVRGDFIAHWDDDDWYPSWRLTRQVAALLAKDADICGSSQIYFLDSTEQRGFRYAYSNQPVWVVGSTLLYRKRFWQRNRFQDLQVGEDSRLLMTARQDKILDLNEARLCVASMHARNTSPKNPSGPWWHPVLFADLQRLLNESALHLSDDSVHIRPKVQTANDPQLVHCRYKTAKKTDLGLSEFAAFNYMQNLPHMRRWELPWTLFAAQLGNTMSVLDCTINPANFGERIARLYPNVLYRHFNPVQSGVFQLPFGFPDESFDRVFCINTLEHLLQDQQRTLIADLARKLKPGGLLLLTSDFYFDSSWNNPVFLNAGVMRVDQLGFLGGWNKTSVQDWLTPCQENGLLPIDAGPWEEPRETDTELFCNPAPFSHATMAGVFSKGTPAETRKNRILLALLTWNTRDISVDSIHAYLREAHTLCRLGCDPHLCVCDNGSTDGTQAALRELESQIHIPYKLILNPENFGNSIARNQIIDYLMESGADYLLFMDGDIEIIPFSSFAMFRYMENCGYSLGCIGADSAGQTPARDRATPFLYSVDGLRTEDVDLVAWTQYGMFRRAVFEQGVRFDENGPFRGPGWGFEDNDLAFQMKIKGFRNQRFFGTVYLHRAAQSSIRIMQQLGFDAKLFYDRRKQYVIDKWAPIAHINNGPLNLVRRVQIRT